MRRRSEPCAGSWRVLPLSAWLAAASIPLACNPARADDGALATDAAALERLTGALQLDRLAWRVAERRLAAAATHDEREAVARELVRSIEPMVEHADPELAALLAKRLERILDQFDTVHVDAPGMACLARLLDESSGVIGKLRAGDEVPVATTAAAIGWSAQAQALATAMLKDLSTRTPPGFEQLLRSRLAWSRLQEAWLLAQGEGRGVADLAEAAIAPLADVLEVEGRIPKPDEVSVDLRSGEQYAWAIVGMAQARALMPRSGASEAMQWMDLVDDPVTAPAVRGAAMEWRLHLCLDAKDWTRARVLMAAGGPVGPGAAPALARVARRAARLGAGAPEALRVVEVALPLLLSSGRGDLVAWVAQALPSSGTSGLVEALGSLAAASNDPAATPDSMRRAADGALTAAASAKGSAAVTLRLEAARLLLRAGDAARAAEIVKESMASASQPSGAMRWLRVQALAAAKDGSFADEVRAMLADDRAGEWHARASVLAAAHGVVEDDVLLALEAVREEDALWWRAQEAWCAAAYERMRHATGASRTQLAEQVLRAVAPPPSSWPDGRVDPTVLRQLVTATLPWFQTPASTAIAGALLAQVEATRPLDDLPGQERAIVAEAAVRIATAQGMPERALAVLDRLADSQRGSSSKAIIGSVARLLQAGSLDGARRDALSRDAAVATAGSVDPPADPAFALDWLRVAAAAVRAGDTTLAPRLLEVADALVARSPDRETLLVALDAARAAHDDARCVPWASRLTAGLALDDPQRGAVDVMLVDSLSRIDRERARAALRQILTLSPEWKRSPQAEPLAELARRLGVAE